jgi:hypothetical protein
MEFGKRALILYVLASYLSEWSFIFPITDKSKLIRVVKCITLYSPRFLRD